MYTTYKFRIKPNKEQAKSLSDWINCSRFVYNKYLEKNIERYNKEKKFFSYVDSNNSLVQFKKENEFLKEVPSQVLQQKVQQLSGNIQKVWKQGFGFPKFKKRDKDESGICFPQGFKVNGRKLKLPKLNGLVNIILHRELIGELKSITIKKDYDDKFFACFVLKIKEVEKIKNPKTSIGLDVGLKTFLVGSDGSQIKNHKFRKKTEKRIKRKQRQISKKKKGSTNRRKVIKKLRRIYEGEFNRKKDFINKTSNQITNDYDIICIEDLNIKGMVSG